MIDIQCVFCGNVVIDHLERDDDKYVPPCLKCGSNMDRVFLPTNRGQILGDECDILIKHGLCLPDGSPQRFRSKEALRKAADKAGWTSYVEHKGTKGGDKSKHTTRWT